MTLAPRRAPDLATRQLRTLKASLSLIGWSRFVSRCLRCLRSGACLVVAGPGSSSGVYVPPVRRLPRGGWSWFVLRCLRASGPPPASRWLALVRPPVFTVASSGRLPGADSPARPEVLLCSCKEVPKKHARLPRPQPAARAGVSLAPRLFAGGAELAAPAASLRHPAPLIPRKASPLGATTTGRKVQTTAFPALLPMDDG